MWKSPSLFSWSEVSWGGCCELNGILPTPYPIIKKDMFQSNSVTLFWNGRYNQVQMSSYCIRMYPRFNDWCSLKRAIRRQRHTEIHTRRTPWDDKEHRELPATSRAWREPWKRFSLRALMRSQPCWHLDFIHLASKTMRE